MSEWEKTQTIRHGNCLITVHRPVLSEAEKKKREAQAKEVLGRVMRNYLHKKEEQHVNT